MWFTQQHIVYCVFAMLPVLTTNFCDDSSATISNFDGENKLDVLQILITQKP